MSDEAPERKPDIWLACAEANKDDLRNCAVMTGGWTCDEDWHYVPAERRVLSPETVERIRERLGPHSILTHECRDLLRDILKEVEG